MEYIVRPGDTLASIAARFGVSIADILRANPQITDPNRIQVGQRIIIPRRRRPPLPPPVARRRRYVVRPGDTLGNIASRFGVSVGDILAANPQIRDPNLIYPGMVIFIPVRVAPPPRPVPPRRMRRPYIVQPGDTLASIARRFGVTVEEILEVNPQITDPNLIYAGQRIFIPVT